MELFKQSLVEMELSCAGIASAMLYVHNPAYRLKMNNFCKIQYIHSVLRVSRNYILVQSIFEKVIGLLIKIISNMQNKVMFG